MANLRLLVKRPRKSQRAALTISAGKMLAWERAMLTTSSLHDGCSLPPISQGLAPTSEALIRWADAYGQAFCIDQIYTG